MTTPGGGFALADAFVRIRPTATGFGAETEAQIKPQLAGLDPTVKVGASTAAAQIKIAGVRALLQTLTKKVWAAQLSTDDTKLQAGLAKDIVLLTEITQKAWEADIDLLGAQKMEAQLLGLAAQLEGISSTIYTAHVQMDDSDMVGRLALLITQLAALGVKARQIRVGADPASMRGLQAIITEIGVLQDRVNKLNVNNITLIDPAALTQMEQAFKKLDTELGSVMPEALNTARRGWLGFWGAFNRVPLFAGATGGVFASVAVWHLVADAIIEAAAVLIPAGIAFGAFAAVASGAASDVVSHLRDVQTVMGATGQAVRPFTNAFSQLQAAITPRVYELFGQAMTIVNDRMGAFSRLAQGAAGIMDQLGARITQAVLSSGFQVFLAHAITDLSKIGDIIGNVFGTIGNLLKAMSGAANVLLEAIDIVTRAIENFTALPVVQYLGRWVIGMHAFWLWAGLVASGIAFLIPVLGRLTGGLGLVTQNASGLERIKLAARDLGQNLGLIAGGTRGVVPALKDFGAKMTAAGRATEETASRGKFLAFTFGALTSVPVWGWVAAGALALTGLVFWLSTTKSATQQWIDSLQASIEKTATWSNVISKLTGAVSTVNRAAAAAQKSQDALGSSMASVVAHGGRLGSALVFAQQKTDQLRGAQVQFDGELNTAQFRLGQMASRFGGLRQAMALAQLAGVKVKDLFTAQKTVWAQDLRQIEGLIQGYRYMGVQSGALGNAVRALDLTTSDQITQVNNLNQAWTSFLGIVQGGDTTFIRFAQDLQSVTRAAQGTGGATRTVTGTFTPAAGSALRLGAAARRASDSLNGLNSNSLQLRSTWNQAITDAQRYYEALQTQSAAASDGARGSRLLSQAGADLIRILAPAAKGSDVMRQSIFALAQQFGFSAKQMQFLIDHTGNLKSNEQDLQSVNDALARSVSNVSKDWAAMATTLQSQVKSALDGVALKSSGAAEAAQDLYVALHQQGPASEAAHQAYVGLITDLKHAGLSYQQAKDYADAWTKGIGFNAAEIIASASARAAQISDLQSTHGLLKQVQLAIDQYSTAIGDNSQKTAQGRQARLNLVSDLEQIGIKAKFGQTQIDNMIARILRIPRSEALSLVLQATGHYSVTQDRIALARFHNPGAPGGAHGMRVPGSGNSDSFAAMLTPGEAVVPKHLVPAVAPFLSAHRVPGFADGGFVGTGSYALAPALGAFEYGTYGSFKDTVVNSVLQATASAMLAAERAITSTGGFGAHAGPGGGAPAANAALARRMYPPWSTGPEWYAWNAVAMRESGWNQFAYNPSGAYGIPQSLPFTKMPKAAWPPWAGGQANPMAQIGWMIGYIKATYGDPIGAWNSEVTRGFYDGGGWLPPGASWAYNGTGRAERVMGPHDGMTVVLEVQPGGGGGELDQMFMTWLRKSIRTKGGNVQKVLGHN